MADVEVYNGKGKPLLWVDSINKHSCINHITLFYCDSTCRSFEASGEMYLKDRCIYLKLQYPKAEEFCLFDFGAKKGEKYSSKIHYTDPEFDKTILSFEVEDIIKGSNDNIHMMRILEGFCYEEHFLDMVFFVSEKRGVIGSYLSVFQPEINSKEYYINPWGDSLDTLVDFSGKSHAILE